MAGAAQTEALQEEDSTALPVNTFRELVLENHPIAQQARLIRQRAKAQKLRASGNFDPQLFSDIQQKQFDEKTYYQLQNSGVKIPAWFGLSAKAGYELNEGLYLNNQNTVPGSGLWYTDISLTLGQGLFIDRRRAMLKQARLLEESADFEVRMELNRLLARALSAYWDWYRSYEKYKIYQNAVDLAEFRLRSVQQAARVGDAPYIDTLEASIQVQDRNVKLRKAEAELISTRMEVETYLWWDGRAPLEVAPSTYPIYEQPELIPPDENWLEENPMLQVIDLEVERLEIEQRLNREMLKPQVDISYKFLNQPRPNDFFAQYSVNNYAWGVSANFPLFLRKERANIKQTDAKIQGTQLDLELRRLQLDRRVEALRQEMRLTSEQLNETRQMVANYQRLLDAEMSRFRNGESSLFLVNQRELRYLDSREQVYRLESLLHQVQARLQAEAGILAPEQGQQ